jgi:hypothetical protein
MDGAAAGQPPARLVYETASPCRRRGVKARGRGFDDHPKHSLGVFAQDYPGGSNVVPKHKLLPFQSGQRFSLERLGGFTS